MSFLGNLLKGFAGPPPTGEHPKVAERRRMAEAGDKESQFHMGLLYEGGQAGQMARVTQDYVESAKWYLKASEQDHHAAQLYLGGYYMEGKGVPRDLVEALKWTLLAKRGNSWDRSYANQEQIRLENVMSELDINKARAMALQFAAEHGDEV